MIHGQGVNTRKEKKMKFKFNNSTNKIEMINEVDGQVVYEYSVDNKTIQTYHSTLYVDELEMLVEEVRTFETFIEKKKRIDEQIKDLFEGE